MKFRDRILRTVVALSVATIVSAQIPATRETVLAQATNGYGGDGGSEDSFLGISGLSGQEALQGAFIVGGTYVIVSSLLGGSIFGGGGGGGKGDVPPVNATSSLADVLASEGFVTFLNLLKGNLITARVSSENGMVLASDTAVNSNSAMVVALQESDLYRRLQDDDGPYTIFAPTDAAFKNLPAGTLAELSKPENKDKVTDLLSAHIVPGKFTADDLAKLEDGTQLQTLAGTPLTVTKTGGLKVNGIAVQTADIQAKNGIVHGIGGIVKP